MKFETHEIALPLLNFVKEKQKLVELCLPPSPLDDQNAH